MNILYVSKLEGHKWQGPNQSVPNQIAAQSKYDNVFWYNINEVKKDEWTDRINCYNLKDYPEKKLEALPAPFNKPDLVVFQGAYEYPFCKLVYDVWNAETPYIVIPRSALTAQAQYKKRIKKAVGNVLFFNKFLKKASAIQYLTNNELKESGLMWNENAIIIPNGIEIKKETRIFDNDPKKVGVFIGRIDPYQKGLDLLIEACSQIREELLSEGCLIKLYGPDRYSLKDDLIKSVEEKNLQSIISFHDAVFDKEKEKIQLEADFFILTSRFEGHPMGLIEALSYGLPCFATEGTNMSEEIEGANAGWVANNTVESIKMGLLRLLAENWRFEDKSNAAKILARKYDWNALAKETNRRYNLLIK
ncbi:glycosyltransferase family 4 protein [Halalkalibacter flavus]|uniref:glycosyltransferase family 4 protein n=1 Tax=Halalkalibacter flavus TaxID=3090668 RepID=UPI002FCB499D